MKIFHFYGVHWVVFLIKLQCFICAITTKFHLMNFKWLTTLKRCSACTNIEFSWPKPLDPNPALLNSALVIITGVQFSLGTAKCITVFFFFLSCAHWLWRTEWSESGDRSAGPLEQYHMRGSYSLDKCQRNIIIVQCGLISLRPMSSTQFNGIHADLSPWNSIRSLSLFANKVLVAIPSETRASVSVAHSIWLRECHF